MKKHKPTYDPRCYDLAELFLEDERHLGTADRCARLAAGIQQYIEDFIASENADLLEEEGRAQARIQIDPDHALEEKRDRRMEDRLHGWEPPDAA